MHDKFLRTGITAKIRGPLNDATGDTLSLMLASADVIDACGYEIERLRSVNKYMAEQIYGTKT